MQPWFNEPELWQRSETGSRFCQTGCALEEGYIPFKSMCSPSPAAVDACWVNAEEDGWWHRGVSPRSSHQSSCWLRSLRRQQPSHKRPVYVFQSLLHAAARLKISILSVCLSKCEGGITWRTQDFWSFENLHETKSHTRWCASTYPMNPHLFFPSSDLILLRTEDWIAHSANKRDWKVIDRLSCVQFKPSLTYSNAPTFTPSTGFTDEEYMHLE